ncbi:MAG: hypothetical protein RLW87_08010 [Alphaproteobacteria bacterium]
MQTYNLTIGAGGERIIHGQGRYLRVFEASAEFAVENDGGTSRQLVQGMQYDFPEGVGRLRFTAVSAVTALIAVSDSPVEDGRSQASVSGTVNVASLPAVTGTVSVDTLPAVTGTVSVDTLPAVTIDAMPAMTGTLTIDAMPDVSGTLSIGDMPDVSGTVSVDNLPATQTVTGTLDIADGPNQTYGASGLAMSTSTGGGVTELIAAGAGVKTVRALCALASGADAFIYVATSVPASWNNLNGAVFAVADGESFNLRSPLIVPDGYGLYVGHSAAGITVSGRYD